MHTPYLSLVVPTYNDEDKIKKTLQEIQQYLEGQFYSFEVIPVNDGSKDGTGKVINEYALSRPFVRPINLAANRGKGYAVRQGVMAAQGKYILFTDSDLSTPVYEIKRMLGYLKNYDYDIVIGSRALPESRLVKRQPFYRELGGRSINLVMRLTILPGIRDTQCGFKGFKHEPAKIIFSQCTIDRFAFDLEVLWLAKKLGFAVKEMPVTWINDPHSAVRPFKDALELLKLLIFLKFKKQISCTTK